MQNLSPTHQELKQLPHRALSLICTNLYQLYSSEDTGEMRYTGRTKCSIIKRRINHIHEAENGNTLKCCWIRDVHRRGFEVKTMLIGTVAGNGSVEERAWIKYGREEGWRLTNSTIGGEGASFVSIATREKLRQSRIGKHLSEKTKEKIRVIRTGSHATKETREKIRNRLYQIRPMGFKGKHHSLDTRKKMSIARSKEKNGFWKKHHTEKTCQILREKMLGKKRGPYKKHK